MFLFFSEYQSWILEYECAIFNSYFFLYFWNKNHWWGLRSESKRLIKTTVYLIYEPLSQSANTANTVIM